MHCIYVISLLANMLSDSDKSLQCFGSLILNGLTICFFIYGVFARLDEKKADYTMILSNNDGTAIEPLKLWQITTPSKKHIYFWNNDTNDTLLVYRLLN